MSDKVLNITDLRNQELMVLHADDERIILEPIDDSDQIIVLRPKFDSFVVTYLKEVRTK